MDWLIDEFLRNVLGLERVADVFGVLVSAAFVVSILLCVRVVWAKGTRPNAALAWIATLLALPVVGALLYLIIGENRVGAIRRRRHARIVRAGCAPDSEWKDPRVLGTSMSTADTQMAHLGEASGGPRCWVLAAFCLGGGGAAVAAAGYGLSHVEPPSRPQRSRRASRGGERGVESGSAWGRRLRA